MAELITTDEFADMIGVTYQTIYNWRRQQHGPKPVFLASKVVRYRLDDVEQWIKDNQGFNDAD